MHKFFFSVNIPKTGASSQLLLQVSVRMMEAQPRKPGWELQSWEGHLRMMIGVVRVDDLKDFRNQRTQKGQNWQNSIISIDLYEEVSWHSVYPQLFAKPCEAGW